MTVSTPIAGRAARRSLRAAVLVATSIAGLFLTPVSHADVQPPVSDVGVTLLSAQATIVSGETTINYQPTATVTPGKGGLLQFQYYNDGTAPQLSAVATIDTGTRVVPNFTIGDPHCTTDTSGSTDVVTCRYSNIAGGQHEPFVYIAIQMNAASVTSKATQTSVVDSAVPVTVAPPDGDDDATAVTNADGTQFAFLTDGQSTSTTSSDGEVNLVFSVPQGGTNGGGVFVNLREQSTADSCGSGACYSKEAVADFAQVGGTPAVASNPFQVRVSYLKQKQTCNGIGGPSGCNPLYYKRFGMAAPQVIPLATTYAPNNGVPFASTDPALYSLSKLNSGVVQYFVAILRDIDLPILNPGK